jgi:hypothetical protein
VCRIVDSLEEHGSFILADGTGVGKGRVIAATIAEMGLPCLWISSSNRLKKNAFKEFETIGASSEMTLFLSYNTITLSAFETAREFVTKGRTLLILDECHILRNCTQTKKIIDGIIRLCPLVLYSSATIASSVKHISYLERIGLWGNINSPFNDFNHLMTSVRRDDNALLELITMDLCRQGKYLCRQLDTRHIEFNVDTIQFTVEQEAVYKDCASHFWNLNGKMRQTLFLKLIASFKVDRAIQLAEMELNQGNSVIFSLVGTGEASFRRHGTSKHIVQEYAENEGFDTMIECDVIDKLLYHFGAANVAEITGRSHRPKRDGTHETTNCSTDIDAFQQNEKRVAILSRAGGTGISLNDKYGTRKRVHIIIEPPWSAEDFLQQLGRAYRSDSKSSPKYIFITTKIPSELRLVSSIIQKMKTLGAIVRAERNTYNLPLTSDFEWNSKTRSAVAFQMAFTKRLPELDIRSIPESQSSELTGRSRQHFMNDILRKLVYDDEYHPEESLNSWKEAVADAIVHFPHLVKSVVQRWSIATHKYYPLKFQQRVFTFLLCARHAPGLNLLPEPLLHMIIEYMANVQHYTSIHKICEWSHLDLNKLSGQPNHAILNDMMCMPIDIQTSFMDLLNSHDSINTKSRNITNIQDFAKERTGLPEIAVMIDRIEPSSHTHCSHKVTLKYYCNDITQPPFNAVFWTNISSGRMFYTTPAGECTSSDNTKCLFDSILMRESTRLKWDRMMERKRNRAESILLHSPKCFHICTEHALDMFQNSTKRILRCEKEHERIIGLLLHIEP